MMSTWTQPLAPAQLDGVELDAHAEDVYDSGVDLALDTGVVAEG